MVGSLSPLSVSINMIPCTAPDHTLPDLDPKILKDDDKLIAIIEVIIGADPMQRRWQHGILKHQGRLRALASPEVMTEYDRVMRRMSAKQHDLVLLLVRWAFWAGCRPGGQVKVTVNKRS